MHSNTEHAASQVFIAWTDFQRRQLSMAPLFGFETYFLPVAPTVRAMRPFQYLGHAIETVSLLKRQHPEVIWVQLPQAPLLSAALYYKRFYDRNVRIIADCHNRILNPPWNKWPGIAAQLNQCDAIVVHNPTVLPKAQAMGIRQDILHVLEDPPAVIREPVSHAISFPRPWLLCLASFDPDEPIAELLAAARLAPDIHFVLAGETDRARGKHDLSVCPKNVILPGWLSGEKLESAITTADAVLAMTKLNDAQLSSAAEAIGAGRPMVLSDTPVTRSMYYKGGVFVDTLDPVSIVQGCRTAIAGGPRLASESLALRDEHYARWRLQAEAVKKLAGL